MCPCIRLLVLALLTGILTAAPATAQVSKLQKAVQDHVNTLKTSTSAEARVAAINGLLEIADVKRSVAKPAIPALVDALKDANANVRRSAAAVLASLEPEAAQVVTPLTALLADTEDRTVRIAAANTLGGLGAGSEPAATALAAIQTKENAKAEGMRDGELLNAVNQALASIDQGLTAEVNQHRDTLLNDPKTEARLASLQELLRLTRKPRTAAPAHAAVANAMLRNSELHVLRAIMEATRKKELDPAQLVPTFMQTLAKEDEDANVRRVAARHLGTFKAVAKDAVPALTDVIAKESAKAEGQRNQELLTTARESLDAIQKAAK
jgi:HEAT repeat protein